MQNLSVPRAVAGFEGNLSTPPSKRFDSSCLFSSSVTLLVEPKHIVMVKCCQAMSACLRQRHVYMVAMATNDLGKPCCMQLHRAQRVALQHHQMTCASRCAAA